MVLALMAFAAHAYAGNKFDLAQITDGHTFAAERLAAVRPMQDGETYAQITPDGDKIVTYSFKTGKQTAVLFNTKTARGPKVNHVDGYIMSPAGTRMLIQTNTKPL